MKSFARSLQFEDVSEYGRQKWKLLINSLIDVTCESSWRRCWLFVKPWYRRTLTFSRFSPINFVLHRSVPSEYCAIIPFRVFSSENQNTVSPLRHLNTVYWWWRKVNDKCRKRTRSSAFSYVIISIMHDFPVRLTIARFQASRHLSGGSFCSKPVE